MKFLDTVRMTLSVHEKLLLFEEHASCGITGFVDERYGFIDEPIYKGALGILQYKS